MVTTVYYGAFLRCRLKSTMALKELLNRNCRGFFFPKRQCDTTETCKGNNKSEVCYTLILLISPHFATTDTLQPYILSHHPSLSLSLFEIDHFIYWMDIVNVELFLCCPCWHHCCYLLSCNIAHFTRGQ